MHRPHSATNECQRHQSARDQSFYFCHPRSQSNPSFDTHSAAAGVDTNLTQFTSQFRTITDLSGRRSMMAITAVRRKPIQGAQTCRADHRWPWGFRRIAD
jgi:hypothetical protein